MYMHNLILLGQETPHLKRSTNYSYKSYCCWCWCRCCCPLRIMNIIRISVVVCVDADPASDVALAASDTAILFSFHHHHPRLIFPPPPSETVFFPPPPSETDVTLEELVKYVECMTNQSLKMHSLNSGIFSMQRPQFCLKLISI